MGLLSNLTKADQSARSDKVLNTQPDQDPYRYSRQARETGNAQARSLWNDVFRASRPKKPDEKPGYAQRPFPGGSSGRSVAGGEASFVRLLQAMRSMAPGGWSDDRWEQTARHFTGITYVAVHRICMQLRRAEFQVFLQDHSHPDGKRPATERDEAWELVRLLKRPNRQDSFGNLMYRWGQQIRLTGMSLTWMVPNYFGRPCELYSIPTAIAIPQPAINPDYPDGYYRIQPVYPYGPFSSYPTPTTAVGAAIGAQWMLKWMYPHPLLRYDGYSPQTGARLEMDSFEMVNRSRFYGLKRGINPSGVLNFDDVEGADPLPEDQIERIKADFENVQQGPENWGKLFVAAPGARLDPWGTVPRDMAYESGWDQLADFILGGVYGITKPAAGMIDNSSYATLFATLKQLNLITLEPECSMIASELTHQLAQFWGDDIIIEIRTPRIDDHDMKLAILSALQNARAVTKNEFRKELEMPVWRNPMGDEIAGTEPLPPMMDPAMMGMPPGAMPMQGMPGQMPMQGMPGEEVPGELEALLMEDTEGIPEGGDHETEIKRQQPIPGKLARGALGPRGASLDTDRLGSLLGTKSLYERVKEVLANGH